MQANEKIRSALTRVSRALTARPSMGQGTGIAKTVVKEGLTCETTEGPWTFVADMPEAIGGLAKGPAPGVYGRAALGSCLAIGYMMRAAALDILITGLEIEIQADYDDGALFGTSPDTVPPGYSEVRYSITIHSEEKEEKLLQLLDEADARSPYLDVFRHNQSCLRHVHIVSKNHH